jgi:DNA processing protein
MYGVDSQAHKLAIESGGKTIAVLGNGLDVVYPVENEKLYTQILETGGVVMSEYANTTKPHLWTYPQRNRIVAALSQMGVLVIEAGENSGSLVTVKWAKKLKRKIYAIPGPITSSASAGTNYILKSGLAKMVLKPSDIVSIENKSIDNSIMPEMDVLETKIYQTLLRESFTLDELALVMNKDITSLSSEISLMCLKGVLTEIGGKYSVQVVK